MNAPGSVSEVPRGRARWAGPTGEVVAAFGSAAIAAGLATTIDVDPLVRIGQVSGLATLEWHYALIALPLVAALVIAARARGGAGFEMTSRLVCAAIAGLVTGMVAGGILVSLHGTPWGLNAANGDAANLIRWTEKARHGHRPPAGYPPLPFCVMGWYADALGLSSEYVQKHMQVIGTAIIGPVVYLCWRLVLRPTWALAVGLVASLPMIDSAPSRPYAGLVLLVLVPVLAWFLGELRAADQRSLIALGRRGAFAGAVMGVSCLTYSGWFQWSAPGFLLAALVVFPWRRAPGRGAVLLGVSGAMFAAVCGRYIVRMLVESSGLVDKYVYFDVTAEPAYIAMYRGDLPGSVGMWPPLGELGGVGLFSIALAAGLALAIALGRHRTPVITAASLFLGAWLMRFYFAKDLWDTRLVQLYPRTTVEILHCLLVLAVFAGGLVIERLQGRAPPDSPLRTPSGTIGLLCGLLLLFAFAGSSISDHYMPNSTFQPLTPGWLSYQAHSASH